jgi:hypothetical protein
MVAHAVRAHGIVTHCTPTAHLRRTAIAGLHALQPGAINKSETLSPTAFHRTAGTATQQRRKRRRRHAKSATAILRKPRGA